MDIVAKSISEFGFRVPILVDKNNVIVCGHTRYKAARKLGLTDVPVNVIDDLTDDQIKAFRLVDNKTNEIATWNDELLIQELANIKLDMTEFNFEEPLLPNEDEFDIEEAVESIAEPVSKMGDIWLLGQHRLMCGDSTNSSHINKLIGDEKIKLIFTSPPYNMSSNLYATYEDNLASQEYINFNLNVVNEYKKYLKGFLFWNISYNKNSRWEFIEILHKIMRDTDLHFLELIVWNKRKAMPINADDMLTRTYEDILLMCTDESYENEIEMFICSKNNKTSIFNKRTKNKISNYWEFTSNNTQLNNHKACFPIELPSTAIKLMTLKNEVVCDPFGGSGTTLMASEKLGRKCLTMEYDPKYVDVIIQRYEEMTGDKAVRI